MRAIKMYTYNNNKWYDVGVRVMWKDARDASSLELADTRR